MRHVDATTVAALSTAAGEWSIITAIMSTGGNAIRIFTTLQLTHDPLLLTGEEL